MTRILWDSWVRTQVVLSFITNFVAPIAHNQYQEEYEHEEVERTAEVTPENGDYGESIREIKRVIDVIIRQMILDELTDGRMDKIVGG